MAVRSLADEHVLGGGAAVRERDGVLNGFAGATALIGQPRGGGDDPRFARDVRLRIAPALHLSRGQGLLRCLVRGLPILLIEKATDLLADIPADQRAARRRYRLRPRRKIAAEIRAGGGADDPSGGSADLFLAAILEGVAT